MGRRIKEFNHPCFSEEKSKKYARIHLPVAPACNIQCNYCNIKYDCANESRPGVTSKILTPEEACEYFLMAKNKFENLSVVGFAGPGDALANFDKVKQTISLIKNKTDDVLFCLSTNGLLLADYAEEIIDIGITHLTITINAVDKAIIPLIYDNFYYEGKYFTPEEMAEILIQNQLSGLKKISSSGVVCKVNILCLEGINDRHVEEIVRVVKENGAFKTNITALIPAAGSKFENLVPIDKHKLFEIRKKCSVHLKQMYHCRQCRADSIGLLGQDSCF